MPYIIFKCPKKLTKSDYTENSSKHKKKKKKKKKTKPAKS